MTHVYPVAIGCSYRFEELNILCEIFKLNLDQSWDVHCFCNLNRKEFAKYSFLINLSMINCFHHIPDETCSPKNKDRNQAKRAQPLLMFRKALEYFAQYSQDFLWVEGDFVPFDGMLLVEQFKMLNDFDIVANYFDFRKPIATSKLSQVNVENLISAQSQISKMPYGYVLPSPIFISGKIAGKIANFISENESELTDGSRNHEGNLGLIFHRLGLKHKNFSHYFCVSYPYFREVDPNLLFFHPHNLFASGNWLKSRGMTKGEWISRVLEKKTYRRPVNGEKIKFDFNCEPILSEFQITYQESK